MPTEVSATATTMTGQYVPSIDSRNAAPSCGVSTMLMNFAIATLTIITAAVTPMSAKTRRRKALGMASGESSTPSAAVASRRTAA